MQSKNTVDQPPFKILESDIFVVSFPKSGNTWVRFLIANMLAPDKTVSFRNVDEYVIDFHKRPELLDSLAQPRIIKSHHLWFEQYPRFIYVYRDGRDAMVSNYFYMKDSLGFPGTFSDFVHKNKRKYGEWHDHVMKAKSEIARRPQSECLVLQYERMLESPFDAARNVAQFCRICIDDAGIAAAVERCAFGNLQKNEIEHGPEQEGKQFTFFRKGASGQWKEMFSPPDLEYYYSVAGEALVALGYMD